MDTLDKLDIRTKKPVSSYAEDGARLADKALDAVDKVVEDAEAVAEKVNWWKVAGYAAAGIAAIGIVGGYAYWQSQQRKPATRLERLRGQLGLSNVDFRDLKSTIKRFDAEQLKHSGRQLGTQVGTQAKKATHAVSQRIAELTE